MLSREDLLDLVSQTAAQVALLRDRLSGEDCHLPPLVAAQVAVELADLAARLRRLNSDVRDAAKS